MAAIDVILPVRNGISFLGEAIDSIRNQTILDWRLLVLDHGSSDGSMELARMYADKDKRVEVYSFPEAEGIAELRNRGLEKCDCQYLMIQDADDISYPNRMEISISVLENDFSLLAIGGDAVTIDQSGKQVGYLCMPVTPTAIAAAGFFYNPMLHPAVMVNFSALRRFGAMYGKDIINGLPGHKSVMIPRLAEDYILFGQLALLGKCVNIPSPLIKYRRHGASVGIANHADQIDLALQVSRFLAKVFCTTNRLEVFDPGPFCNHADYVFDLLRDDYSTEYARMADALRHGLGESAELERELAFRWVLATRNSIEMARRYLSFHFQHSGTTNERRTVRNWLLRNVRNGKYVYRANAQSPGDGNADAL
jgi:glycosyltransferase involved in cell wall biosynthesis